MNSSPLIWKDIVAQTPAFRLLRGSQDLPACKSFEENIIQSMKSLMQCSGKCGVYDAPRTELILAFDRASKSLK